MAISRFLVLFSSAAAIAACTSTSPEQQFVDTAAEALGGRDRVLAVGTIVMEGTGRSGNLGQDMTWTASGQQFELTGYRRVVDVASGRSRIEETRTPNFMYWRGPAPQRQVTGLDGEVAFNLAENGRATRVSAEAADERRTGIYHHPLTIVRAMLDPSATVRAVRAEGQGQAAEVTVGDRTYLVYLDASGLPSSVRSDTTHPNLGDVTIETSFGDYQGFDELRLPTRITTELDGHVTTDLQIERYALGGEDADLAAPAAAASAPAPQPSAPTVEVTQVADGIWWLAGQSHHSALVEFADHLLLIEAPQSEARTMAVIAKARELVPSKPLTQVVVSHHHFDHTGGLRAAIAEGMTVIAHRGEEAFVEEIAKRPHTRRPDALQKAGRDASVITVDDRLVLEDASMRVEIYPVTGNPHADTLLMAYIPRERVLIEADAFSPEGGTYHPYAANLLENIRSRKLQVDRIVPLHGTIVPFADLVNAVEAQ